MNEDPNAANEDGPVSHMLSGSDTIRAHEKYASPALQVPNVMLSTSPGCPSVIGVDAFGTFLS